MSSQVMSSQEFQVRHGEISDLSVRLLGFLNQYRQMRLLKEKDNTESLQSVEEDINLTIKALDQQKYEVAIIAPMKAGKSTFLNAIIGADILASEAASCTIRRTDIRHIEYDQTPKLYEHYEDPTKTKEIAQGNAHEIQIKFLDRTREIRRNELNNQELPTHFELLYPIEAIGNLSALSGFTLIDTPGPNEWKSISIDTVALKQVSLEALRTCKVVLFILNYRSFRDNAVEGLFKSITEGRKELISDDKSRIFFILNQVDLKSERDPEIVETVLDLKKELSTYGFSDPIVYPVSSLQGLLAKLIHQGKATENQIKDFKKFFSARYAIENEDGSSVIPAPQTIANRAIEDSGIIKVQEMVFQTVVQTSGWNLLSDALNKLEEVVKSIENTFKTGIAGWEMELESLRSNVEEYENRSKIAKEKVKSVRESIDLQKEALLELFSKGIDVFTDNAKDKIKNQIDLIAQFRVPKDIKKPQPTIMIDDSSRDDDFSISDTTAKIAEELSIFFPSLSKIFKVGSSLLAIIRGSMPQIFSPNPVQANLDQQVPSVVNPYIIQCATEAEAKKVKETINEFCAPHIQNWWINTQDQLVRKGEEIRGKLVKEIQDNIQTISNELSNYLGNALEVEINVKKIQFPSFEFKGIDAQIHYQQRIYTRIESEWKTRNRCCASAEIYKVDTAVEKTHDFFEIDLAKTNELINERLEEQSKNNKNLLCRVIKKQVTDDFKNAENQIYQYINKFQTDFKKLLKEREKHESKSSEVLESLRKYSNDLHSYQERIESIKSSITRTNS